MDRPSLIAAVTPIMTLIALFTGITLPFIAASRSGRSHAGGGRRNPALMTPPPPDTCTSPAPASATTATRPGRAAGSKRCRSSRRRPS